MGIGASIFLIALGLILALAVHTTSVSGIDIHTIGWILVAAGVLGILLTMVVFAPRRRQVRSETVVRRDGLVDPATPVAPRDGVVEERRYTEDG